MARTDVRGYEDHGRLAEGVLTVANGDV